MHKPIRVAFYALAGLLTIGSASAQSWPTRPVTVVVPFAAGSSTDTAARILSAGMSEAWTAGDRQNIGGAAGMTGTTRVARAVPDGYQLVFANRRHCGDRSGDAEEAALRQHQRFHPGWPGGRAADRADHAQGLAGELARGIAAYAKANHRRCNSAPRAWDRDRISLAQSSTQRSESIRPTCLIAAPGWPRRI